MKEQPIVGVTDEEYNELEGLRCTELKQLLKKSPHHVNFHRHSPAQGATKDNLLVGRITHAKIFEPDRFNEMFQPWPKQGGFDIEGRSKAAVEIRESLQEETDNGDAPQYVKQHQFDRANALGDSGFELLSRTLSYLNGGNPVNVKKFMSAGYSESVIVTEINGVKSKVKFDWILPPGAIPGFDNGLIIDCKTCADASKSQFEKSAANYGYDVQEAFYSAAYQEFYGTEFPPKFLFLVIEKPDKVEDPVTGAGFVGELDPAFKNTGRADFDHGIDIYKTCEKKDIWPNYTSGEILGLTPPSWRK